MTRPVYCWCGHTADRHETDYGITCCISCAEHPEEHFGNPYHTFEAITPTKPNGER